MTSHKYAQGLRQAADMLLSKPAFDIGQEKFMETLTYWNKNKFTRAALAMKGKREYKKWACSDVLAIVQEGPLFKLQLVIERDRVCHLVKPAEAAVYDCEPLFDHEEESIIGG